MKKKHKKLDIKLSSCKCGGRAFVWVRVGKQPGWRISCENGCLIMPALLLETDCGFKTKNDAIEAWNVIMKGNQS